MTLANIREHSVRSLDITCEDGQLETTVILRGAGRCTTKQKFY